MSSVLAGFSQSGIDMRTSGLKSVGSTVLPSFDFAGYGGGDSDDDDANGDDEDDPLRFFEGLERNIAKATSGKKLVGGEKLDLLEEDVENLQNFEGLDKFRIAFGNLIDSDDALGEFSNVGLEGHLRKLYGAMIEDLDASLRKEAARRGQVAPGLGGGSLIELSLIHI